ncbi:MAG TPA: hypothetical protein VL096_08450, partial [Pirellulaceae bacterium]|nr:hypothetical protein [Pirellulaceae bacterium]
MNHNPRSDSGSGAGVAIALALGLVILIALVGAGAGFFLFASSSEVQWQSGPATGVTTTVTAPSRIRFLERTLDQPLSALDIKETLEAPVVAFDADHNLQIAYASQTAKDQRTLYYSLVNHPDLSPAAPRAQRETAIFTSVSQMNGKEVKRPLRLLPQLVVAGKDIYLGWIEPNAENTTVIYYVAKSIDGGVTFGEPLRVHESDAARPNFIALAADAQGNLLASWLDHRAGIQQPFASVRLAGEAAFQPEQQIYASPEGNGVCPCCPTAALITPNGRLIVAFRNQLAGHRDIFIAERQLTDSGAFSEPVRVLGEPTWKFDGCPHDGPSLATDGSSLFVGWMDAHTGTPRVYVASRPLSGGPFSAAENFNTLSTGAQGCVKLAASSAGDLHAVWEESPAATETKA